MGATCSTHGSDVVKHLGKFLSNTNVLFIWSPKTAALSHTKPYSAGTSCDRVHA